MREGVATVFCLGNAFCGSANCVREVKWAVRQGFATIPVFLEWLCRDEEAFSNWKSERAAVPGGPESLLDGNAGTTCAQMHLRVEAGRASAGSWSRGGLGPWQRGTRNFLVSVACGHNSPTLDQSRGATWLW